MVYRNASKGSKQKVNGGTLFELFDLADEWLALIDADGEFVRMNRSLAQFLGVSATQKMSWHFLDHVSSADRPAAVAALQQAAAGEAVSLTAAFQGGEGAFRPVRWKLAAAEDLVLAAGRYQEEARSLPETGVDPGHLLDILEAAPDIIGISDPDGSIRYINPAGREVLGIAPDRDLSQTTMTAFVPDWAAEVIREEGVPTALRTGIWLGEIAFHDGEGNEIPVSQLIIAHRGANGKVARFSTIIRDLRQRTEAEARLARQAQQLELVTEVSAIAASILEVEELLRRVVDLTRQYFELYHAHIYLLNAAGDTLLLAAGSGEIGRQMVAEGQAISLDTGQSLVARVARNRAGLVVNDVRQEPGFLPHRLLPETRAEMAVPVMAGDKLVGVLDVQAAQANRFTEADVSIQTALAAQIATAIENARSFEQAQQAVAEMDLLTRRLTQEGWENYMAERKQGARAYLYDATQVQPVMPVSDPAPLPDLSPPTADENGQRLAQSLEIHGATVGHLALESEPDAPALDEDTAAVVAAVAAQLSARIENLRLTEQTQMALAETSALYQAGSELNRAYTYRDVLEVLQHHTIFGRTGANSAIMFFDSTWSESNQPQWIEVAATIPREMQEVAPPRLALSDLPMLADLLRPDGPLLIADVTADERIGGAVRDLFAEVFKAKGMVIAPLVVGGQWIGYVAAHYPESTNFAQQEINRLLTLVGQAAVAIQSISLLEETSRLLASEQRQRRIADTMLRATERMSGLLAEDQIREIMVDEIHSLLRPSQVSLYQWLPGERAFTTLQRVGVPGASRPRYPVGARVEAAAAPELWQVFDEGRPSLSEVADEDESRREAYRLVWLVGNEQAGVMEILRPAGATLMRDEDRASVVGLVQQAAIRLQNARLFAESKVRADELTLLNEMGRALTALTDVDAVMETVYEYTARLMDATNFYVGLYDAEQDLLSFPLAVDNGERVTYPPRTYGAGMTEHLIELGAPLLLSDNVVAYLESVGIDRYGQEARSWLGVPLILGDRVLGVVALQSFTKARAYDEHSREVLNSIASQAVIAIQNAGLFEEIQQRVAETQALYEASRAINTAQSFEAILAALSAHTFLDGAHHVSLNYFDRPWTEVEQPGTINVLARRSSLPQALLPATYEFSTFPSRHYLENNPVLIEDVGSDPRIDDSLRRLLQVMQGASTVFVPLVAGGQRLGFIHGVFHEPTEFPESDVVRLNTMAGQAAVAIQGLWLLQDAQRRVRREQILREVTSSVRSVTDVELILKTAARQVGQALGRETFVYLGDGGEMAPKPATENAEPTSRSQGGEDR